jgi:hypothetical protein
MKDQHNVNKFSSILLSICSFTSWHQNAGQNRNTNFEVCDKVQIFRNNKTKLKSLIKSKLNVANSCYHCYV